MYEAVFDLLIEMQEWAIARPELESSKMASVLEQEVKLLLNTENDQGASTPSASTFSSPLPSFVSELSFLGALTFKIPPFPTWLASRCLPSRETLTLAQSGCVNA
jgi:hypothetical protein